MSSSLSRREFGKHLLTGLGAAAIAPSALVARETAPGPRRQPNVVLVICEQYSYRYAGFMGHPFVRTPNLDRIAARGTVFRHAYCSSPVCAPGRAGLLSGCYPSDVNSFCNSTTWDGSLPAWPALLRDAGYRTFGVGKMDADNRFDLGFQNKGAIGNEHATHPDITSLFRRPLCSRIDERPMIDGSTRAARDQHDENVAAAAIGFIKQAPPDHPWALYAGPTLAHPPYIGLEDYFHYYLNRVDLPNVPPGHLEQLHFVNQQLRHFKNIATPIPEERMRRARAAYFAMITELDEYVGQIWAALEASGQLENTVFAFTADHGEALGDHGLWLKNNLYDGAARIPLVLAGGGIPAGKVIDTPVGHVDLTRTFLEWGGAKTHERLRGHSLAPLLRNEPTGHPGFAYCENHTEGNCTGSFLIRKGDWKYIHFTWYDGLLFNLADDPGEFVNRINDPAAANVLQELRGILASQVDPVEETERAFKAQRRRYDGLVAAAPNESAMVDQFRGRLGDGQAIALLSAYYGHAVDYRPSEVKRKA